MHRQVGTVQTIAKVVIAFAIRVAFVGGFVLSNAFWVATQLSPQDANILRSVDTNTDAIAIDTDDLDGNAEIGKIDTLIFFSR